MFGVFYYICSDIAGSKQRNDCNRDQTETEKKSSPFPARPRNKPAPQLRLPLRIPPRIKVVAAIAIILLVSPAVVVFLLTRQPRQTRKATVPITSPHLFLLIPLKLPRLQLNKVHQAIAQGVLIATVAATRPNKTQLLLWLF